MFTGQPDKMTLSSGLYMRNRPIYRWHSSFGPSR